MTSGAWRSFRELHGKTGQADFACGQARMWNRLQHLTLQYLRVGEDLVDRVHRSDRHAGVPQAAAQLHGGPLLKFLSENRQQLVPMCDAVEVGAEAWITDDV